MKTPREVFRFLNTLSVTYSAVKDEVDIADFIAIEALRVFRTETYNEIRENKSDYTAIERAKNPATIRILGTPDNIKQIIDYLFPNLRSGPTRGKAAEWRKSLRVCSPDNFDIYFRFSVPPSHVTNQQMRKIIALGLNREEFTNFFAIQAQNHPIRCKQILDRLADYYAEFEQDELQTFIENFISISDYIIPLDEILYPSSTASYGEVQTPTQTMLEIIIALLGKIEPTKRYELLNTLIIKSEYLYIISELMTNIGIKQGKYLGNAGHAQDGLLTVEEIQKLEEAIRPEIKSFLPSKSSNDKQFRTVLDLWKYIDPEEPSEWLKQYLTHPVQVIEFIGRFISLNDPEPKVSFSLYSYLDRSDLINQIEKYLAQKVLSMEEEEVARLVLTDANKYVPTNGILPKK